MWDTMKVSNFKLSLLFNVHLTIHNIEYVSNKHAMMKIICQNMQGMTERGLPLQPSEWQKQIFVVAPAIFSLWHIPRCTLGLF